MGTKGYGSYRGRSAWRRIAKIFAIVLLVLVVLCAIFGIYLQQFLIISDDGVHLELPFAQPATPSSTPSPVVPSVEVPVVVTPEPTPEPTPTPAPVSPVPMPDEALHDGTALDLVRSGGGDCALFDIKTDNGRLNYTSALTNAVNGGLNPDDSNRNAAIQTLNQTEGLYTVARVSCFKDHGLIEYDYNLAIHTNSGYRWTDPEGIRWSSPTNPNVREYLTAICVELAQLGFDEILLANAGYPNQGNLHYIKKGEAYDETRFSAVIDGFYAQIALALADYDVTLSVVTTAEALAGNDALTGQTPENLTRFDRLWTRDEAENLIPLTTPADPH